MLRLACLFFAAAVLAATFGFSGITPDIAYLAKQLSLLFLILMGVCLALHLLVVRKRGLDRGEV